MDTPTRTDGPAMPVLNYLRPGVERPVYIASQGGSDAALSIGAEFDPHAVEVCDARLLDPPASLNKQGFCLVAHTPSVSNFYDLASQQSAYDAEICELVVAAAGAQDALVFDHTLRSDSREIRGQHGTREPASVIHNDYTDASAAKRLRDLFSPEEAERRLDRRFAIINVWRSINGPILRSPLAMCDFSSALPTDFVASERRAKDRIGELELVTYNTTHRWYYFSQQQFDESLLLKTFDSATDGIARRVAHTAFYDPATPADAPARESIESRVIVFFRKRIEPKVKCAVTATANSAAVESATPAP